MSVIKKISAVLATIVTSTLAFGQPLLGEPEATVKWSSEISRTDGSEYEVIFTGVIKAGEHSYSLTDEYSATELSFEGSTGIELVGEPYLLSEIQLEEGYETVVGTIKIGQKFKAASDDAVLKGMISYITCSETTCSPIQDWEFSSTLSGAPAVSPENPEPGKEDKQSGSLWGLIIEAILWGFAMLLTPCVFPMVPMTISYFIKGSESKTQGRFKALIYGLFIIVLYTVPICVVIGLTWALGGESVTADIFNWIATHWLPNIIFFIIFMIFAASFFGAFEITLPSKWVNSSDQKSDRKGLAGIFFLALTLVLVSFSCTGPIVGTVLIKSTSGEFWAPMVTMLAFSVAFALPFTILALFPSLLKNLPKSGGWLNSVKVVLGFIEVALGLKFLSTADQTYHWGLLDREVYLAIWIVCFSMMGLYLLGKLRFANDSPLEYISVKRLALAIGVFSFVVYLIPGMWGAPLKALSGYLPPMETQDFRLPNLAAGDVLPAGQAAAGADEGYSDAAELIELPHGLVAYNSIESALAAAKVAGKPVFVDITGHGCVNCREMEARVWSDPSVLAILKNEFILAALYTDDKAKLPENKWITTESGKVLKDVGRMNSYIVRERFGVQSQPNYVLLSQEGELLAPVRGYDLSIPGFVEFLSSGIEAFKSRI